ncbi:unnamed protein product, partial [Urochloa humidicola]
DRSSAPFVGEEGALPAEWIPFARAGIWDFLLRAGSSNLEFRFPFLFLSCSAASLEFAGCRLLPPLISSPEHAVESIPKSPPWSGEATQREITDQGVGLVVGSYWPSKENSSGGG